MKNIFMLFILVTFSMVTNAASFDCKKASTTIEVTICADDVLSQLDEDLNSAYKAGVQTDSKIRDQQRAWIKNTRNTATSVESLEAVMKTRLTELQGSSSTSVIKPMMREKETVKQEEAKRQIQRSVEVDVQTVKPKDKQHKELLDMFTGIATKNQITHKDKVYSTAEIRNDVSPTLRYCAKKVGETTFLPIGREQAVKYGLLEKFNANEEAISIGMGNMFIETLLVQTGGSKLMAEKACNNVLYELM